MMTNLTGYMCSAALYEFEGWLFETPGSGGPWPVKKNGELRARAGARFYRMIKRWQALSEAERQATRIGGGCTPLVEE